MICPICDGDTTRLFQKYQYWIRRCKGCGHHLAELDLTEEHVRVVYGDEYFHGGAGGYPDYFRESEILEARGRWYGRLMARFAEPGIVLDVGAAAGFVLKGFQDSGWRGVGLEPNSKMADHARSELGLQFVTSSLEGFRTDEGFDVVAMIQVIAHFYDLRGALERAAAATRNGGFWLIESWDRGSLLARVLGRKWHEYNPPSTLHWFSQRGLSRLVGQFGFSEVAHGRPPKRLTGAHAKSVLRQELRDSRWHALTGWAVDRIPDHVVIRYPALDLHWTVYQKDPHAGSAFGNGQGGGAPRPTEFNNRRPSASTKGRIEASAPQAAVQ